MGKAIKKIRTILTSIVLVIMGLTFITFIAIFLPPVQNGVRDAIINKLQSELNLRVDIGAVRFFPFSTIKFFDVKVYDTNDSPFVEINELKADIALPALLSNSLNVNSLIVDSLNVSISRNDDGSFNFDNSKLNAEEQQNSQKIQVGYLNIKNSNLSYRSRKDNFFASDVNVIVRNIDLDNYTKRANIIKFSFFDDYRHRLFNTSSNLIMKNDTLTFEKFESQYGASVANIDTMKLFLSNDSIKDFYVDINKIILSDSEAHLIENLNLPNSNLEMSGVILSKNSNIRGENILFNYGTSTSLLTQITVSNYNDINALYLNADINRLATTLPDLQLLVNKQATNSNNDTFGEINFYGKINGFYNKLSLNGVLTSQLGKILTAFDIDLNENKSIIYNGNMNSSDLNLSNLTNNKISEIQFDAQVDGRLDNNELIYNHIKCKSDNFKLYDYKYDNILLDVMSQKESLYGVLDITDKNGSVTTVCECDGTMDMPHYSFTAKIDSLRTGKLNLTPSITEGNLNLVARADFVGNDIENIIGQIWVGDIFFAGKSKNVVEESLTISLSKLDNNRKQLSIDANSIKGNIVGNFRIGKLISELKYQMSSASNILFGPVTKNINNDFFAEINLEYAEIEQITQFISDDIKIEKNGMITGFIDSDNHISNIIARIGDVEYGQTKLENTVLTFNYDKQKITTSLSAKKIEVPILGKADSMKIVNALKDNALSTSAQWGHSKIQKLRSALNFETKFQNTNDMLSTVVAIAPTDIVVADSIWRVGKSNLYFDKNLFIADNFSIRNNNRYLSIDGSLANSETSDTLHISFSNITIEDLLRPDSNRKFAIAGDANAQIELISQDGKVNANALASINRFFVNNDYLDHLDIKSNWLPNEEQLKLDLAVVSNKKIRAHGLGGFDKKSNLFDLNFDIDSISDGFLNFYLGTPIKDIKGSTSGWLRLHGLMPDLKLDAHLCVHRTEFTIRQSLVKYVFDHDDTLIIAPNYIEFCNIQFSDPYGKKGNFYGHISHNMFSNLGLHINFQFNNQLVLQTTATDNSTYYGTIFANGLLSVTGTTSSPILNIDAQTAPKTDFYIQPLEKSDLSEKDYIKFRSKDDDNIIINRKDMFDGVSAKLNVEIQPDAQIHAVLNPRTSNMITANGLGKLRLDINKTGDLSIMGNYTIQKGIYNFSFENILNKQFVINDGSIITWNGDPYNANVDLTATYKVKAALSDLVVNNPDIDISELKRRVPINCNIILSNRLLDPTIHFKIEVPSSQNFNQYTFDQYVNTEEEMNRQVFSLLLTNRFYAIQDANSNNNASNQNYIGTTATDLLSSQLSNQISNWISQNKYNVGVGVNYRPGDEVTNEEYEVALSTQMLDNKIILSGNIGYGRSATESSDGSFIGDFDLEVKLNKKGNLRAKAYTHSNNDIIYETSPTTQGVGISFNEEFNSFGELMRKYWNIITGKRKKEKSLNSEEIQR